MVATIVITSSALAVMLGVFARGSVIAYKIVRTLEKTVDGLADLAAKFAKHIEGHETFATKDEVDELRDRIEWLKDAVQNIRSWRPIPPMRHHDDSATTGMLD